MTERTAMLWTLSFCCVVSTAVGCVCGYFMVEELRKDIVAISPLRLVVWALCLALCFDAGCVCARAIRWMHGTEQPAP